MFHALKAGMYKKRRVANAPAVLLFKKEKKTEGGEERGRENVISSRPPTDSGQHSHERRVRRRFVRNLRSYAIKRPAAIDCLSVFVFFSLNISCGRQKKRKYLGKERRRKNKSYSPIAD